MRSILFVKVHATCGIARNEEIKLVSVQTICVDRGGDDGVTSILLSYAAPQREGAEFEHAEYDPSDWYIRNDGPEPWVFEARTMGGEWREGIIPSGFSITRSIADKPVEIRWND